MVFILLQIDHHHPHILLNSIRYQLNIQIFLTYLLTSFLSSFSISLLNFGVLNQLLWMRFLQLFYPILLTFISVLPPIASSVALNETLFISFIPFFTPLPSIILTLHAYRSPSTCLQYLESPLNNLISH